MNPNFSHLWFKFIHQNFLIYNMCWEDVEIDRKLLEIDSSSQIMMITSAGCNALSYLLDDPKLIHTVDINTKQTALLDLKINVLKYGTYQNFKELFWDGKSDEYLSIYQWVKDHLKISSLDFWENNIHYFHPNGNGLFLQGGTGMFARFLNRIIDKKGIRKIITDLSTEKDTERRRALFSTIEEKLWSGIEQWIWSNNGVLSLAGIPASQRAAIGDMNGFMKTALTSIFVDQQASENPYWGKYLRFPTLYKPNHEYLKEIHFEVLRETVSRLEFKSSSFNNFLHESPCFYTHFVLLDHMDWLTGNNEKELHHLWDLLIKKSAPNSKILFRTAFEDVSFIPKKAFKYFDIEKINQNWIRQNDRVGTYKGTYLARLK